jgi:hypothetical protein
LEESVSLIIATLIDRNAVAAFYFRGKSHYIPLGATRDFVLSGPSACGCSRPYLKFAFGAAFSLADAAEPALKIMSAPIAKQTMVVTQFLIVICVCPAVYRERHSLNFWLAFSEAPKYFFRQIIPLCL